MRNPANGNPAAAARQYTGTKAPWGNAMHHGTRRLLGAAAGFVLGLPALAQTYDAETPRRASQLLQPAQYQSAIHKVDDAVPIVVHTYLFTLQTSWGPMKAYGYDALVLRLRELSAIQALDDTSKTEAYGKALGRAATAPIRVAEHLVEDPGGTISGIPRGIGTFFGRIGDSIGGSGGSGNDSVIASATGAAAKKRAIAVRYNVSPYSTNKVLQDKIAELARAEALGGLTMSAATMGMGGAGMVFTLGRTSEGAMALLRDRTPGELHELNYETLRKLAVPHGDVRAFLANPSYNPAVQTHLAQSLGMLVGTRQIESFVRLANTSDDESEAFLYQRIAQMMAGYHRTVAQLDNVGVIHGLPVALSVNRDAVVFAPVDELLWTARSAATVQSFEQIVNPLRPRRKELWISGYASAEMKRELSARGWTVNESARGRLYDIM
jgi:hypothetical protein